MNREEILSELKDIQERFVDLDVHDLASRDTRREELAKSVSDAEYEIKKLREKLGNDTAYIDKEKSSPLYLMMQQANLEEYAALKVNEEKENEAKFAQVQSMIETEYANIATMEEEIVKLGATIAQNEVAIGQAKMTGADTSVIDQAQAKMDQAQADITTLENEITMYKGRLERYTQERNGYQDSKDALRKAVEEAQETLNRHVAQVESSKEKAVYDFSKKDEDETRISDLQREISAYGTQRDSLDYNFYSEVTSLLSSYENGTMTEDQLRDRMIDVRGRMPEEFIQSENEIPELVANRETQARYEAQIVELQEKLQSEQNYLETPASAAQKRAVLTRLQRREASIERQLAFLASDNIALEKDVDFNLAMIAACDEKTEDLASAAIAGTMTDAELREETDKNIETRRQAEAWLDSAREQYRVNQEYAAKLESTKEKLPAAIQEYQEHIMSKTDIDKIQMRRDEKKVANMQAALLALKAQETTISLVAKVDEFISRLKGIEKVVPTDEKSKGGAIPIPIPVPIPGAKPGNGIDDDDDKNKAGAIPVPIPGAKLGDGIDDDGKDKDGAIPIPVPIPGIKTPEDEINDHLGPEGIINDLGADPQDKQKGKFIPPAIPLRERAAKKKTTMWQKIKRLLLALTGIALLLIPSPLQQLFQKDAPPPPAPDQEVQGDIDEEVINPDEVEQQIEDATNTQGNQTPEVTPSGNTPNGGNNGNTDSGNNGGGDDFVDPGELEPDPEIDVTIPDVVDPTDELEPDPEIDVTIPDGPGEVDPDGPGEIIPDEPGELEPDEPGEIIPDEPGELEPEIATPTITIDVGTGESVHFDDGGTFTNDTPDTEKIQLTPNVEEEFALYDDNATPNQVEAAQEHFEERIEEEREKSASGEREDGGTFDQDDYAQMLIENGLNPADYIPGYTASADTVTEITPDSHTR